MLEQATQLGIIILLTGIAYQAGQHSNRIQNLEEWKKEFSDSFKAQFNRFEDSNERKLNHIERLIKDNRGDSD